ncbi:MAG: tetratricopeptide repeat protein [Alphaproteobacteria bacterium]|jgi:hypothetical protein|nr:tetratricopeptide repeat protein [Alphaproteobacteria bacterium]
MAEKFDEFLEEVQKDIRQEKFLALWKQYGRIILSGLSGIIVLIVAYNLWCHYDKTKRLEMADKLISAQELIAHGDTEKALVILNNMSTISNKTYQPLAVFQKAGLLLKQGDKAKTAEAIGIYKQLAKNTSIDPLWRDLATFLAVMGAMDDQAIKPDELIGQLEELTKDTNPWRYFAREMKGVLLHRKGDSSKAAEIFAKLVQDNQTPAGISMRSRLMVQIVSTNMSE